MHPPLIFYTCAAPLLHTRFCLHALVRQQQACALHQLLAVSTLQLICAVTMQCNASLPASVAGGMHLSFWHLTTRLTAWKEGLSVIMRVRLRFGAEKLPCHLASEALHHCLKSHCVQDSRPACGGSVLVWRIATVSEAQYQYYPLVLKMIHTYLQGASTMLAGSTHDSAEPSSVSGIDQLLVTCWSLMNTLTSGLSHKRMQELVKSDTLIIPHHHTQGIISGGEVLALG